MKGNPDKNGFNRFQCPRISLFVQTRNLRPLQQKRTTENPSLHFQH